MSVRRSFACGRCPFDVRSIRSMFVPSPFHVRSMSVTSSVEIQNYSSPTDKERKSNGDVTYEYRTKRMSNGRLTDKERISNGRQSVRRPVKSFEHAQNSPPDKTDTNGHQRTTNGFTG